MAIAPRRPLLRSATGLDAALLLVLVCAVTLPSVISTARVIGLDRVDAALLAHDDPRLVVDERVGKWYADHRTGDSTLFAMCASAGMYAAADAIPPFPYLWLDGVQHGKDAQDKLVELFSGVDAPTFVAMYQRALTCNPSGQVTRLLQQRYATVATVQGARILVRRDSAASDLLPGRRTFTPAT